MLSPAVWRSITCRCEGRGRFRDDPAENADPAARHPGRACGGAAAVRRAQAIPAQSVACFAARLRESRWFCAASPNRTRQDQPTKRVPPRACGLMAAGSSRRRGLPSAGAAVLTRRREAPGDAWESSRRSAVSPGMPAQSVPDALRRRKDDPCQRGSTGSERRYVSAVAALRRRQSLFKRRRACARRLFLMAWRTAVCPPPAGIAISVRVYRAAGYSRNS